MALPPSVPTSFVPHAPSGGSRQSRADFSGATGFLVLGLVIVVTLLAIGVFAYDQLLKRQLETKDAALSQAQLQIDLTTVKNFVRLRDRLDLSQTLLDKHVAFSNFFASIGTVIPTSVRFSSLHVSFDSSGTAKVDGSGVAKSFNALAAVSMAFAEDSRIKDAIFSKINIGNQNAVSFDLSASLDPKLVAYDPSGVAGPGPSGTVPAAAQTASTTPSP